MVRRPHKNDISIGQDKWIRFGNLAGDQARAIQIDPHLAPVMPFFERLETECVADCCGIDAFQLWPEEIEKVIATLGQGELATLTSELASVQSEIERLHCNTVVSTRMNQYFRRVVFLEVLTHIRNVVESVHAKPAEPPYVPPYLNKNNDSGHDAD